MDTTRGIHICMQNYREKSSSQASKLERDSKRKSFIYSSNLKN